MGTKASGAFEVKSWNEETYEEIDGGAKLTRVSVTQSFSGDFVGEGTVEYLMIHRSDGNANFVGLQRLIGRIGDRSGSVVLETNGTFDGSTARSTWSVVPGSGTGGLRGLRGKGGFIAELGPNGSFTLDYDFE